VRKSKGSGKVTRDVGDGDENDGHQVDLSEQRLILDGLKKKEDDVREKD